MFKVPALLASLIFHLIIPPQKSIAHLPTPHSPLSTLHSPLPTIVRLFIVNLHPVPIEFYYPI